VCNGTGRPIAFAKVGADRHGLQREQRVLEALAAVKLKTFRTPRVLAFFDWQERAVLVLERLPMTSPADRVLAEPEIRALLELAKLGEALRDVLGSDQGGLPVHGDFAPWNSSRTSEELTLWDWEDAHLGSPLEDYFHWHIQRAALLSGGQVGDVVKRAQHPDAVLLALCDGLSVPPERAPVLLGSYLERSLLSLPASSSGARTRLKALELLDASRS
jgi:hypothetical protein